MLNIILILGAYLLGSIPSAVWIGKSFYGIDVREHGSQNAGATNTLRVLGRKAALVVFIMDILKGTLAVNLALFSAYAPGGTEIINLKIILVVAAVLGHIFPVFAGFKGGKGVATLTGSLVALFPLTVLVCFAIFFITLNITHYVSLSSMITGVLLPIISYFVFGQHYPPLVIFSVTISILLIITHRKNIKRLLNNEESKIYLNKKHTK